MDKIDIKSLSEKELGQKIKDEGQEAYRAKQIFRWLYKVGVKSFEEMLDIPLEMRHILKKKFHITHPATLDSKASLIDGTTKYLFKLEDGATIESVFLPEKNRNTICLSSQVGCKMNCSFCASAPFGFVRNLRPSEIVDEVLAIRSKKPDCPITNLVFMGIGEPLDNYDNVMRAIRLFNDKDAFNIGARRITISTCGLIPGIKKLMDENLQLELSVSLHSADEGVRSELIPVNKRYPLRDLMQACRDYIKKTGRIITFEYIMIKGVNCSAEDAFKLSKLLKGIKCKVNTIAYNQIKARGYEAPGAGDIRIFMNTLKNNGINAISRKSKGEDIDAGCGQLRISRL